MSMTKALLIAVITAISFNLGAQKNGIGLNLLYDATSGLNLEGRYEYSFTNRLSSIVAFSTNIKYSIESHIGLRYKLFTLKKLSGYSGLDYSYLYSKTHYTTDSFYSTHYLSLPVELRLSMTKNLSALGSFSIPFSLDDKRMSNYIIANIRLGVIYKF